MMNKFLLIKNPLYTKYDSEKFNYYNYYNYDWIIIDSHWIEYDWAFKEKMKHIIIYYVWNSE